jgi:hypothetical protein
MDAKTSHRLVWVLAQPITVLSEVIASKEMPNGARIPKGFVIDYLSTYAMVREVGRRVRSKVVSTFA